MRDPAERSVREQRGGAFLSHRFDKLRISAQRHGVTVLALDPPNVSVSGLAQAQCLFQDGIEYRREIAWGRIDDLQHLGGRGLLLQRFVALGRPLVQLGSALVELASEVGDDVLRIG
jgi:hypothetical protein